MRGDGLRQKTATPLLSGEQIVMRPNYETTVFGADVTRQCGVKTYLTAGSGASRENITILYRVAK
jgi:hypothetical protein